MTLAPALPAEAVAAALRWACNTELEAPKPGNVHVFAAGHGMAVGHFRRSAAVSAGPLARPGARVGERVLAAVQRTREAVGCNTNLGILLLAAPLAAAAERATPAGLADRVRAVLAECGRLDAADVYEAIRLASPGGLGRPGREDVAGAPTVGLIEAMALAADRDRIAWQYANGFREVFEVGVARLGAARARAWSWPWASVACHLRWLSLHPDSHVLRKHGAEVAESVRAAAAQVESGFEACDNPALFAGELLRFDNSLKRAGINPGTQADLTVASLFAFRLQEGGAGDVR